MKMGPFSQYSLCKLCFGPNQYKRLKFFLTTVCDTERKP